MSDHESELDGDAVVAAQVPKKRGRKPRADALGSAADEPEAAGDEVGCCGHFGCKCRVCEEPCAPGLTYGKFQWEVDKGCHNALRSVFRMATNDPEARKRLDDMMEQDDPEFKTQVRRLRVDPSSGAARPRHLLDAVKKELWGVQEQEQIDDAMLLTKRRQCKQYINM